MAIPQQKNSSSGHESLWNVSITSCDVFLGLYHQSALFNSSTLFFSLHRVQMIASERASERERGLTKGENCQVNM